MQKYANLVELEKCCRTHIFLQKFVLIQPRTSPLKFAKFKFRKKKSKNCQFLQPRLVTTQQTTNEALAALNENLAKFQAGREAVILRSELSAKFRSFSAVSAPIFARKYTFCSIFQNLQDYQADILEIWQNFANFATFAIFLLKFHENC